jgi:hypothetical protein
VDLSNRSLKAKARAVAWELIAELNRRPPAAWSGRRRPRPRHGPRHRSRRRAPTAGHHHVGLWLSPIETADHGQARRHTMTRIDLARRCGLPYDPKFKTLVANLIDRGILFEPDDESGVKNTSPPRRKSLPQ